MSVRRQIAALLAGVLLFSVAATGFALLRLVRAGDTLGRVAERDVPLLSVVTDVTAAHLEQSLRLERALRHSLDRSDSAEAQAAFAGARHEFDAIAAEIWRSLQRGRDAAGRAVAEGAVAHDDGAAAAGERAGRLAALLAAIDAEHNAYAADARRVFGLLEEGRRAEALALVPELHGDEARLQESLGELLRPVGAAVAGASEVAQTDERRALAVAGGLVVASLLLSAVAFAVVVRVVSELTSLSGLLPICAHCKRIRDDRGYWNQLEAYLEAHSEAEFTHGICAECQTQLHEKVVAGRARDRASRRGAEALAARGAAPPR